MSNFKVNFDFKDIQLNTIDAVDKEILVTANLIATEAKETVPIDTTDLQKLVP